MNKPATRQLSDFFKKSLAPALAALGFVAQGRVFRRAQGAALQMVELELGKYNDASQARFTVELGVCYPQLLEALAALEQFAYFRPRLATPGITECVVRQRLGMLIEPPADCWWSCGAATAGLPAAEDIIALLSAHGLPWLAGRASLSALVATEALGDTAMGIAAHARLGERATAMASAYRLAARLSFGNSQKEADILVQLMQLIETLAPTAQPAPG
jgi:hypothetical protein